MRLCGDFLLRCPLFCHSVATFLTSVSSYEGGCGFEVYSDDMVSCVMCCDYDMLSDVFGHYHGISGLFFQLFRN